MPYRLVPGPLLKLAEVGSGAAAAGAGAGVGAGGQEERRRFLVLYEIVASEGSDRPPPTSRGEHPLLVLVATISVPGCVLQPPPPPPPVRAVLHLEEGDAWSMVK